MKILKLIGKNAFRHRLRAVLTTLGIAIAVVAFCTLRTVVTAWHAGVEAASADRLITRHAVSFIFPLTYAYKERIARVPGVEQVSFANWFGGVYIDQNQFFARLAVDAETFLDLYPEFVVSPEDLAAFRQQRNACIIGADLAERYGLERGDIMNLEGDIYPGQWDFVVRGVYEPKFESTDASQMLFHWDYLNERVDEQLGARADEVGWYIVRIRDAAQAATVSARIDALFANSSAETKTETERAFQQGFLSASGAILSAMNVMSFVIVGVIMLVLANTMVMAARERTREVAVLKALGFSGGHLAGLILGESLLISVLGGGLGLALTMPMIDGFAAALPKGWFPVFQMAPVTVVMALAAVLLVGVASAVFPLRRSLTTRIVDGFRYVG